MIDLLLASDNAGKLRELRSLLPDDVIIRTLGDLGLESPEETGATIAENAVLKAVTAARVSGILTLADDSGLEVVALGGRPGVRSARFAGEDATDQDNIDLLLSEMSDIPAESRAAGFVCVLTLANAQGALSSATGRCAGSIGFEPRGVNGFGYDPVFILPDGRTMAELDSDAKNAVGHRGQALRQIFPALLVAIGVMRFATEELVNGDHATHTSTLDDL